LCFDWNLWADIYLAIAPHFFMIDMVLC